MELEDLVKWDCIFYKSHQECLALLKMTCKNKDCKFYKKIGDVNGKN